MNVFARRSFMKALSAAGLGGIVGGLHRSRAFAATGTRKLVMVFASGGWDTTWSIEPKDGTEFDIPVGTRTVIGGLPIWTDPSRPLTQAFFTANAARTCIVNGIEVRSISHPECTRRMLCGLPGTGNPDVAAIAGHTLGADQPIGYLMLGNAGYTGPLAASAGRVGATNQIVALLDEELGYPQLAGDTTAPFVPSASEQDRVRAFLAARVEREREGRGALGFNASRIDDYASSLDRAQLLRDHADDFGTRGLVRTFEQQSEIAVEMLAAGVAWSVNIDAGISLDTHETNDDQGPLQETLFGGLTTLVDLLAASPGTQGGSLLDETLVLVVSEMTRTPKLNDALGKDHWTNASAMVIGPGVAGGRVVGGTDALGQALTIDLDSGETNDVGVSLEPKSFAAGVLELLGGDPEPFYPGVEVLHALRV